MRTHRARALHIAGALVLLALTAGPASAAAPSGSLSGRVLDAAGRPITTSDICLVVRQYRPDFSQVTSEDRTTSRADGSYAVGPLPPGDYYVMASDCPTSSRDDLPTAAEPYPVTVGSADRPGVDARMAPGTSIAGRVTGDLGAPLAGQCVYEVGIDGTLSDYRPRTTTGPDGRYVLRHLTPGPHKLLFSDCSAGDGDYAAEYYDDVTRGAAAAVLDTTSTPEITGIDARLTHGGRLAGTVRDGAGTPIASGDVCVRAYGPDRYRETQTDEHGSWSFAQLPDGDYHIHIDDCPESPRHDIGTSYGGTDSDDGVAIALPREGSRTGLDVALPGGTAFSGTVTDADGTPLPDVCVFPDDDAPGQGFGRTDADGRWSARRVPARPGGYGVRFRDCASPTRGYVATSYGGTSVPGSGARVPAVAEEPQDGIDAQLTSGATATGRVLDATGTPIRSLACVELTRRGAGAGLETTPVGADGRFAARGLPAGTYDAVLADCGDQRSDAPARRSFAVTDRGTADLGDVRLPAAAEIDGRITGPTGRAVAPVAGICVSALRPGATKPDATARTDADGSFDLGRHLDPAVGYAIRYTPCTPDSAYATTWSGDAADREHAQPVRPPARIGLLLRPGAPRTHITSGPADGGVTDQDSQPVTFANSATDASFACEIDGRDRVPCRSPVVVPGAGAHRIAIFTTVGGRTTSLPEQVGWTVARGAATRSTQGVVLPGGTLRYDPGRGGPPGRGTSVALTVPFSVRATIVDGPPAAQVPGARTFSDELSLSALGSDTGYELGSLLGGKFTFAFVVPARLVPAGVDPRRITLVDGEGPVPRCSPGLTGANGMCVGAAIVGADGAVTVPGRSYALHAVSVGVPEPKASTPTPSTPTATAPAPQTTTAPPTTVATAPAPAPRPGPGVVPTPTTAVLVPPSVGPTAPASRLVLGRPTSAGLASGVRVPVACATRCAARIELRVDAPTARRAHLRSRRIASRAVTLAPGPHAIRLVPTAGLRASLGRRRSLRLTVVARIPGAPSQSRTVLLRR